MNTHLSIPKIGCLFLAVIIVLNTTCVCLADLPPDPTNAALLYYQAFLLHPQPNEVIEELFNNYTDLPGLEMLIRTGEYKPLQKDLAQMRIIEEGLREKGIDLTTEKGRETYQTILDEYYSDLDILDTNLYLKKVTPTEGPAHDLEREILEHDVLNYSCELFQDVDFKASVRDYLKEVRPAIETFLAASKLEECRWGHRYSQGIAYRYPFQQKVRQFVAVVIADNLQHAINGDVETALAQCMAMHRFAGHYSGSIVPYMTSLAVHGIAIDCTAYLLSHPQVDLETLEWLKKGLPVFEPSSQSLIDALALESECVFQTIRTTPEVIDNMHNLVQLKGLLAGQKPVDGKGPTYDKLIAQTSKYYLQFQKTTETIMNSDKTFVEKDSALKALTEEFDQNYLHVTPQSIVSHPEKMLGLCFAIVAPIGQVNSIYEVYIRHVARYRRLLAAIEAYSINLDTGQLPETLPAHCPNDPYTDKPFEYERTKEGFILRCDPQNLGRTKANHRQCEYKVNQ